MHTGREIRNFTSQNFRLTPAVKGILTRKLKTMRNFQTLINVREVWDLRDNGTEGTLQLLRHLLTLLI